MHRAKLGKGHGASTPPLGTIASQQLHVFTSWEALQALLVRVFYEGFMTQVKINTFAICEEPNLHSSPLPRSRGGAEKSQSSHHRVVPLATSLLSLGTFQK